MLKMMRFTCVPRHHMVFDYLSHGDLFYMVIKGKVVCKVPFHEQYIHLSESEAKLFKEEFKDDLLNFVEARNLNSQLNKMKSKRKRDAFMKDYHNRLVSNPYEGKSREELV